MADISISEAARRWKVSRSTIQRKIKSGELSVSGHEQVRSGKPKTIDISELVRVFGDTLVQVDTRTDTRPEISQTHVSNDGLIQQVQAENSRLIKQNELLLEQVEKLHKFSLDREQKLLEHQTKPLWKKIFG